jgi:hypothetical protein
MEPTTTQDPIVVVTEVPTPIVSANESIQKIKCQPTRKI